MQSGSSTAQATANSSLASLSAGLDAITTGQTVVGSRLNWISMTADRSTSVGTVRTTEQQALGSTDITSTVAQLQQTMLVLQASQAGFAKLSTLNLFNVLQ
jgi:flagellar hook-associated protein 3 FlgL